MARDHVAKTVNVYDSIAQDYSKNVEDYTPELERNRFITLVRPQGKILDVGCAAGRDSIFFTDKGYEVIGVDLSDKLLKIAQKRAPKISFQKQDIRLLTFPQASFDGIWACAVLLHLKRKEVLPVLKKFNNLLKPDAVLFTLVKQGKGEADVKEVLSSGVPRHFTFFETDELNQLLTQAGFSILDQYTWNSLNRWPDKRDVEWISSFSRKV